MLFVALCAVLLGIYGGNKILGNITSGGSAYICFAKVCLIAGALLILLVSAMAIYRHTAIEKLYPMMAMVLGILYIFLIPPLAAPDEAAHFGSAYDLASEWLGIPWKENIYLRDMRLVDASYQMYLDEEADYDAFLATMDNSDITEEDLELVEAVNTNNWFYTPYYIAAFGLMIGRMLKWGFGSMAALGTFCNLLFFVGMMTYAIHKLPFGKRSLFVVALLPITLQQASSFSYDNPIIACTTVAFALALHWIYDKAWAKQRVVSKAVEILLFLFCVWMLAKVKSGAYLPVVLLPVLLAVNKGWFTGHYKRYTQSAMVAVIILAVIYLFPLGHIQGITALLTNEPIMWHLGSDVVAHSPLYFMTHPTYALSVLWNTLRQEGGSYIFQMAGGALGALDVYISKEVVLLNLLLLLLSAVFLTDQPEKLSVKNRIVLFVIAMIPDMISVAAMLFYWTEPDASYIQGVQGRYFIPTLPLVLYSIGNWPIQKRIQQPWKYGRRLEHLGLHKNIDGCFAIAMAFSSYAAMISVLYVVA
jgi:uncharacterized membrane protein